MFRFLSFTGLVVVEPTTLVAVTDCIKCTIWKLPSYFYLSQPSEPQEAETVNLKGVH